MSNMFCYQSHRLETTYLYEGIKLAELMGQEQYDKVNMTLVILQYILLLSWKSSLSLSTFSGSEQ